MDIRTILVSLIIVNFSISVFMFITQRVQKTYPGYFHWSCSVALVSLLYILLALRGFISNFLSIVVANSLISAAGMLRISGIRSFFGLKTPLWTLFVIPLFTLGFFLFLTYGNNNIVYRNITISVIMVLTTIYIAKMLFIHLDQGSKLLFWFYIIMLDLFAVVASVRSIY
jgi:hypothetical protein